MPVEVHAGVPKKSTKTPSSKVVLWSERMPTVTPLPVRVGKAARSALVPCAKSPCVASTAARVRGMAARIDSTSACAAALVIAANGSQPPTSFE